MLSRSLLFVALVPCVACYASFSGSASPTSSPLPAGVTYTELSVGSFGACAVRSDGGLACWGNKRGGRPTGRFSSVSNGHQCACAVHEDQHVSCWPFGLGEQPCPSPDPSVRFTRVDASGAGLWCGLTPEGDVHCWGALTFTMQTPGGFSDLALGAFHVCVVTHDGGTACFGPDSPGYMSPPATRFRQIAMSTPFPGQACGVTSDGGLKCWGVSEFVSEEDKPEHDKSTRARITLSGGVDPALLTEALTALFEVSTSEPSEESKARFGRVRDALRVRADGTNDGLNVDASVQAVGMAVAAAAIASFHAWGRYELAAETRKTRLAEYGLDQPPEGPVQRVSVGYGYVSCAVRADGTLSCWGRDCDDPTVKDAHLCYPPSGKYRDIGVGNFAACALTEDGGQIRCWGDDIMGACHAP